VNTTLGAVQPLAQATANASTWGTAEWVVFVGTSLVALDVLIRVVAPGTVPANRRPSSGMAWVILILVVPFLGFLTWLTFGRTSIGRRRDERQAEANRVVRERVSDILEPALAEDAPEYLAPALHLNRQLGAFPPVSTSGAVLYSDYDGSIAAMAAAVDQATDRVHVEFYIMAWDETTEPFFAALVRATERGVPVRLLFDHLGTRGLPVYKELRRRLAQTSIEWHPMLPLRPLRDITRRLDLRNHRKILVIDGTVAFMGSLNMTEPGYNKPKNHRAGRRWVELTCRVEGALARSLEAVFLTDWYTETGEALWPAVRPAPLVADERPGSLIGQIVPSGPGIVAENNLRLFTTLIYGATTRLSITSPYFVPDESLLYAVTTAAQRGVDVELFVGEEGDQFMVHHAQRSYYRALLDAGVKIYLYEAPLVLHSKHFSVDDDLVVLGSSNMDMRSFALNYEVSMLLVGTEVVDQMRAVEDAYRARSRLLTSEEWARQPYHSTYLDNLMRLTAALQ
jgi:cardiolipin synthase A/B